jgi:hypothetical protein
MEEQEILDGLVEEFFAGWEVIPTGGGFLITTDWVLPNKEQIEIHVRRVGDREDLFLVTDGGEIVSYLFSEGIDIAKEESGMKLLTAVAENHGASISELQMVKGATGVQVTGAVRALLEAVKEASFLLWRELKGERTGPVH